MPCALRSVPVGLTVRVGAAWLLVTGRIRSDMMVRSVINGDTGAPWVCDGSATVVEILEPSHRTATSCDAVRDPVAGVADMGPLFAARGICPECELYSTGNAIAHRDGCSRAT